MPHHLLKISILILTFATMADGHPQTSTQSPPFKPGQSVYIVAMKSNCSPDFDIEFKLKEEFEKQKIFKVATSLQSADFVFLMYLDYGVNVSGGGSTFVSGFDHIKNVTAFAVSPATYTQFKSDLYSLRDEALWKWISREHIIKYKGVVQRFNQEMRRLYNSTLKK